MKLYYRGTNYFDWDLKCPICESLIKETKLNEYSKQFTCEGSNIEYIKEFGVTHFKYKSYKISKFGHFAMKISNYNNRICNMSFNFWDGSMPLYNKYKVRYIDNSYERMFEIWKNGNTFLELDIKRYSNILNFNEYIVYLEKVRNFA